MHAAVRERRADEREVAAVDDDGALPEVPLERAVRVADHAERPQQVRDRAVAVPRDSLGLEHRLVDVEGPPAKLPYASSTAANDVLSATREEAVIAPAFTIAFDGTPVGRERDRVERVAARLDPMRVPTASAPCRSSASA